MGITYIVGGLQCRFPTMIHALRSDSKEFKFSDDFENFGSTLNSTSAPQSFIFAEMLVDFMNSRSLPTLTAN